MENMSENFEAANETDDDQSSVSQHGSNKITKKIIKEPLYLKMMQEFQNKMLNFKLVSQDEILDFLDQFLGLVYSKLIKFVLNIVD